jgi:pilus assembly protein CpaC
MHRNLCYKALPWGGLIFALMGAIGGSACAFGQEPSPEPAPVIVPINSTVKLQMSKKQKIKTVTNPKENVVSLRTLAGDPTTILITGQQDGVTHIELEDTDGNKESYEVIVQVDVEYLRIQLRRALPTANVTVIPLSKNPDGKTVVLLSGTVTHDADTAVVRGLAENIGFKYIDAVRVGGVQQVQLDVIIAQVNRTDLRNLTFNFLGNSRYAGFTSNIGGAATLGGGSSGGGSTGGSSSGGGSGGSSSGTAASGISLTGGNNGMAWVAAPAATTNLLLGFVHNAWGFQNFLEALRSNGLAKLLAEPRLVTLSGRPASFLVGGLQAVPQTGQFGGTGVSFQQFGTTLSFLPIVLGNGKIYLEVSPSVSSLDQANGLTNFNGTNVPGRNINYVTTTVELEPGQTFVIGGLIQHQVQAIVNKVPCLGDLKYFGALFRSVQYQDSEQEVLVIVTPWLVDAESCNQRPQMLPGEETRRPDNFELFLEGIIEAPRGPRQVYQDHHYVPAWMNSPSAALFPCVGKHDCGCGPGGCRGNGGDGPASEQSPASAMPAVPLPPQAPLEAPLQPTPKEGENASPAVANDSTVGAPESGGER